MGSVLKDIRMKKKKKSYDCPILHFTDAFEAVEFVPEQLDVHFHSSCVSWLSLGSVSSSSSASQMASGISLVSFNSRPDGMHQRSYSVSSADQWSDATVIANSGVSTGRQSPSVFVLCVCWSHTLKFVLEKYGSFWRNQATLISLAMQILCQC